MSRASASAGHARCPRPSRTAKAPAASSRVTSRRRSAAPAPTTRCANASGTRSNGSCSTTRSRVATWSAQAVGSSPTGFGSPPTDAESEPSGAPTGPSCRQKTVITTSWMQTTTATTGRQRAEGRRPSGSRSRARSAHGTRYAEPRSTNQADQATPVDSTPPTSTCALASPIPTKKRATASSSQPVAWRGLAAAISTPGATNTRGSTNGFHGTLSPAATNTDAATAVASTASTPDTQATRVVRRPARTAAPMASVWAAGTAAGCDFTRIPTPARSPKASA